MSNVVRPGLASGLASADGVLSATCRCGTASIALTVSELTGSLQTSYLPNRAGDLPNAMVLLAPAIITTVLLPAAPSSNSRTNISRPRSLVSQNRRHSIIRYALPSPFFSNAILRT